jgi:hypothetical protein
MQKGHGMAAKSGQLLKALQFAVREFVGTIGCACARTSTGSVGPGIRLAWNINRVAIHNSSKNIGQARAALAKMLSAGMGHR